MDMGAPRSMGYNPPAQYAARLGQGPQSSSVIYC